MIAVELLFRWCNASDLRASYLQSAQWSAPAKRSDVMNEQMNKGCDCENAGCECAEVRADGCGCGESCDCGQLCACDRGCCCPAGESAR